MVSKIMPTSSTPPPVAASGLSRQTSIYSWTLDEFLNAVNEPNKSFGSMNMDEFLKNIWTAEETQAMAAAMAGGAEVPNSSALPANLAGQPGLAKQGSLTLPRNIIGKTVDEVWREINTSRSDNSGSVREDEKFKAAGMQRELTFGEMTLEDFLAKAGVVREDCGVNPAANCVIPCSNLTQSPQRHQEEWNNFQFKSNPCGLQVQQPLPQQQMFPKPQHLTPSPQRQQHLMLNPQQHQQQMLQHQQQIQQQHLDASMPLFAKRLMPAAGVTALQSSSASSAPEASIESGVTSAIVPVGFGKGLNLSPSTMLIPETAGRGKKRVSDAPENKIVEQRQRRMIKNRESAARSRERKQAHTVELETEVTQLKEENAFLKEQDAEATKKRYKQLMEMLIPVEEMRRPPRVIRRTRSIHW